MDLYRLIERKMKDKNPVLLAVDGRCGSGKSTIAEMLADRYAASVIHMDDFFLRPEQRTMERLKEPGGNVDRERFMQEVVRPLLEGREKFEYQRYDCARQELAGTVHIVKSPLIIVEGACSCHPYFGDIYDIRVFMNIDPGTQKERISARNGPEILSRFVDEWIPKEEEYFEKFRIKEKCDICLEQTPHFL